MAGVMSLMQPQGQQGPMPGQASQQSMPGMMPQQGAPTPAAMVGPLTQMHMQQLVQLMLNPRPDGPPLYAVLSALSEKQKAAKTAQAAQGQQVMAQNAQMQQQPPVAAQVMQAAEQMGEPVMAAYGGEMQGYAGGGAVAFRHGGGVQHFRNGADEFGVLANPEAEAMDALRVERAQKEKQLKALEETYYSLMMQNDPRAAQVKQQLDALSGRAPTSPPAAASAPTRQGKSGIADLDIGPSMAPLLRTGATSAAQQLGSGRSQQRQQAAPAPVQPTVANPATAASPADLSPEMAKALADREAQMRSRLVRPESLVAAEQGLAALAKSNIEAQQAEAKTFGDEARAARDAALARSQRNILNDPMSLLALAGSIDTRRGQGVGSLARGAAGLMGQREAAAEAARKEFTQAQRDERSMQANIRQTQMLEAQRQVALEQGKLGEVNAINDKLSELAMKREEFRIARGDKAFEQQRQAEQLNIEREKITSSERIAELNRKAQAALRNLPGPEQQMIERAIKSLMASNPSMSYYEAYDKARGAGRGVEEKAELANAKQRASIIQNELKVRMEVDPLGKSPRVQELQRELNSIYRELGGGTSLGGPASGAVDKNNPLLK